MPPVPELVLPSLSLLVPVRMTIQWPSGAATLGREFDENIF